MPVTFTAPRGLAGLARPLRAMVAEVLRAERRRAGEISLVLADDAFLRRINRDLLVSMDRVRAQSRRYRVTPGVELARLVAHGTLHLCGHDHARARERARMRARERFVLGRAREEVRSIERALGSATASG